MTQAIGRLIAFCLLAAIAAGCREPGEGRTLRVANWLPPSHVLVRGALEPWARSVEEATEGRVRVEIMASPLGPPGASFDIALDGLADVAFGVHTYTPGRFVLTEVAELPFLSDSAEALSVALWRVHREQLASANEHRGLVLLGLWTHGPSQLFTTRGPVTSGEDLSVLKLRIGGEIAARIADVLGTVSVTTPATKAYETLVNGVADGLFFPSESVAFFNLADLLPHATLVPGGLFNSSFFLVVNESTWESLTPRDGEAIRSVSGEALARLAGRAWDDEDERGIEAMRAAGTEVSVADGELLEALAERLAFLESTWIERAEEKGVDGARVLEALRREIRAAAE